MMINRFPTFVRQCAVMLLAIGGVGLGFASPALAQDVPELYIGQIIMFANPDCPEGMLPADGRSVEVASYQSLSALYESTYGASKPVQGEVTEFNLPDLRGRSPIGSDSKQSAPLGTQLGAESVTLTADNLPSHTHSVPTVSGTQQGSYTAESAIVSGISETNYYDTSSNASTTLSAKTIESTGMQAPVIETVSPSLGMNFCVVMEGTFPSRS